jgi:small redox-active disulfide protein 2
MGCQKCKILEQHAREAVSELGLDAAVEKVADMGQIAAMGVMSTPALAVDGKVVSVGRVLTKEQVMAYLSGSKFVAK